MDTLTIITSVISILSISFNFIQWWLKKEQEKEKHKVLISRSQASFNNFSDIEYNAGLIEKDNSLEKIKGHAKNISGIARSARQEIVAYSREHLNVLPVEDLRKGEIYQQSLPRPT